MTEILPNLHWIKRRISNVYLWAGETGLALFDTGLSGDVDPIFNYIEKIGRQPTDLIAILITHADIDHAGGAAALQARSGATIFAAQETAEHLTIGQPPTHNMPRLIQTLMDRFGKYKPIPKTALQQITPDTVIPDLESWQILATPGHTMDHHSFFNLSQGILIAGDALNTRGGRLNCSPPRITADNPTAHKSARQLLRLTPAVIACGHGEPFIDFTAGDIMTLDRQLS